MRKRLAASLAAFALVGAFAASTASAAITVSETIPGNFQCPADALKIDPVANGTYNLPGGGTITITTSNTPSGWVFSFLTDDAHVVSSMVVKGGPNYNLWTFDPPVHFASGIHAPLNLNNGKWYGLSHLCIFSQKKGSPPPKK